MGVRAIRAVRRTNCGANELYSERPYVVKYENIELMILNVIEVRCDC